MKKILLFLVAAFAWNFVSAQALNPDIVPQSIKNKLNEKYPGAKGVVWKQTDPGFVDAQFNYNDTKYTAIFASGGGWVSSEYEIEKEQFPAAALEYLGQAQFADKVIRYYKSESAKTPIQYAADAKKEGKVFQFVFDENGKLVMRAPKK